VILSSFIPRRATAHSCRWHERRITSSGSFVVEEKWHPISPPVPLRQCRFLRPNGQPDAGGVVMGMTFPRVTPVSQQHIRTGGPGQPGRFKRRKTRGTGKLLVKLTKTHSSETFVACDDPLEGANFSVFVKNSQNAWTTPKRTSKEHVESSISGATES